MVDECNSQATGSCAEAEGCSTTASGECSHAEGGLTVASGAFSHAEGLVTVASNDASHAGGWNTLASGRIAYAEGENTQALGLSSHAEGFNTVAQGESSHAEGRNSQAVGYVSHAQGESTIANGLFSHAEGRQTLSSGEQSHAEGFITTASGPDSHAEGFGTIASGGSSHTEGFFTNANGLGGVHVMGQGVPDDPDLSGPIPGTDLINSWYLVNGSLGGVVAKILNNGNACFEGVVNATNFIPGPTACDYAEMFETSDGSYIDAGYFVTFDGESNKVRKANSRDDYILGVTSGNPGIIGDAVDPLCSKFLLDEWNRPIYEEVTIPAVTDNRGNVVLEERREMRKKLNPDWDPRQGCSSRLGRIDWVAVGMLGKLLVRDDGTCNVGHYCRPNDDGMATASDTGYRVIKRTGTNQIMIVVSAF